MSIKVGIQDGEGDAAIRVGTRERFNIDDLQGECSACGHDIYYRPEPPYLVKFLCLECAGPLLNNDNEFRLSSKTVEMIAKLKEIKGA